MKLHRITLFGAMATALLTGCELKEELWGEENADTRSQGTAILDVSVKLPVSQTRTDETPETRVNTKDFPVTIKGIDGVSDILKEYTTLSEVPNQIILPVGKYEVSSHTPGEIKKQMTEPYYAGSKEINITKGIITQSTVICKMKNSHIRVNYGESFRTDFTSWTITIDDGSRSVLRYDNTQTGDNGTYWYFEEGEVEIITVNIQAVTSDGNTVSEQRQFSKKDANESEDYDDVNDYFEGGDAIIVQMGSVASSTGDVTGITIGAQVTFSEHAETVEIPVYGETVQPITISDGTTDYLNNGVEISSESAPNDISLQISAPEGIKNLYLKITSTDATLQETFNNDFVGNTATNGTDLVAYTGTLFEPITSGAVSYTFNLSAVTSVMSKLKATAGTHTFTLKVMDNKSQEKTAILRVINSPAEGGGETPPAGDGPSLTFQSGVDKITYTSPNEITYSMADTPASFDAYIKAPKGIKSIYVTIKGGNDAFDVLLVDLKMDGQSFLASQGDGVNIVGNTDFNSLLSSVGLPNGPIVGDTEYNFPIGVFFNFLGTTGATDEGKAHTFNIVIEDQEGNKVNDSLKMHLTE